MIVHLANRFRNTQKKKKTKLEIENKVTEKGKFSNVLSNKIKSYFIIFMDEIPILFVIRMISAHNVKMKALVYVIKVSNIW